MADADSDSLREICELSQMILFGNDAVEVTFKDGGKVQISGCGTVFVHDTPNRVERHRLHNMTRITQRTQFATSEYQLKVLKALAFKNRYSSRPYLCPTLPNKNGATIMYEDIRYAKWPESLSDKRCEITNGDNGALAMTSLDGHASITLAPHGQTFSVRYLAKMSENARRTAVKEPEIGKGDTKGEVKWSYTRVSQHHSTYDCPQWWSHPLKLLLNYRDAENINDVTSRSVSSNIHNCTNEAGAETRGSGEPEAPCFEMVKQENGVSYIYTRLPPSLPLVCSAHHLHKWRQAEAGTTEEDLDSCYMYNRVKVVFTQTAIYRVVYTYPRHIEIYPVNDGSIMLSRGMESDYYDHHLPSIQGLSERTYSVRCPPPDSSTQAYSVRQLIRRADRIVQCVNMLSGSVQDQYCWQDSSTVIIKPPATVIMEDQTVDGVGNFQACSNGRIRVLFTDRTRLDVTCDLARAREQRRCLGVDFRMDVILPKFCRLLLPNGQYEQVSFHQPSAEFLRYVDAAKDWINWVITSEQERTSTFSMNAMEADRQLTIQRELKKIECFNYILDNAVLPKKHNELHHAASAVARPNFDERGVKLSPSKQSDLCRDETVLSATSIAEILKRTQLVIQEIDTICHQ